MKSLRESLNESTNSKVKIYKNGDILITHNDKYECSINFCRNTINNLTFSCCIWNGENKYGFIQLANADKKYIANSIEDKTQSKIFNPTKKWDNGNSTMRMKIENGIINIYDDKDFSNTVVSIYLNEEEKTAIVDWLRKR